jgi:hypothetical protein
MHSDDPFEEVKHFVSVIIMWKISERGIPPAFNGYLLFPISTGVKALTARIQLTPAEYQLLLRFSLDTPSK